MHEREKVGFVLTGEGGGNLSTFRSDSGPLRPS